jgi:DNA-binding transcriptional MerR regulator
MTVDQLLTLVNERIEEAGIQIPDGRRASRYVDIRSFRFYRAKGLIDPPTGKEGVSGLYSERHMLQLMALKALQSSYVPLPEIKKRLAKASDEELQKIVSGETGSIAPRTNKVPDGTTTNQPTVWVQFPVGSMAIMMVEQEFLTTASPSRLRALGQNVTTQLLAWRG